LGYTLFNLYKSTDGGVTWSDISPGSQLLGVHGKISSIVVDPKNDSRVWITYEGFKKNGTSGLLNENIFYSSNGGTTWSAYFVSADNLPLSPTSKVVYQEGTNDRLFISTDEGVYMKDGPSVNWICYNKNLPHVVLTDLDIDYCNGKIAVSTYGRGIWESPLPDYGSGTSMDIPTKQTPLLQSKLTPQSCPSFLI